MLFAVIGVVLIALALRDVFDTLFHPHGHGVISERVVRLVWRVLRGAARARLPLALTLAGPLAFSLVLLLWVGMVTLGGALLIEPALPDDYQFAPGVDPESYSGLADAVTISLVNLTSLGYGDAVATGGGLRILGPLQALTGLLLITASVSWVLSIYRVITAMAVLARDASSTVAVESFETLAPEAQWPILSDLSSRVTEVRRDLIHFPISYYFHSRDARSDLSVSLPPALELCGRLEAASSSAAVRFHARRLSAATVELADTARSEFFTPDGGGAEAVFARWRHDHMR